MPGPGAWLFDGEFMLCSPRRRVQDYAIVGTAPLGTPIGTIRGVEGNYDPGFRIGVGYRLPGTDGLEVMGRYTYWHSAGNDAVSAGGGSRVFPTLTHPAFIDEVGRASADNAINMNVFDVGWHAAWKSPSTPGCASSPARASPTSTSA